MQRNAIKVPEVKLVVPVRRCMFALATVVVMFTSCAQAAPVNDAPIYLKGTVLAIDEQPELVTLALAHTAATPPPALTRFAVPKLAGPAGVDDAVVMLGSAIAADKKIAKWQVRLTSRAMLKAWGVAPFRVGDTVGVVGLAANASDVLQAHYLIGDGKVTPLRAAPR